MGIEQIFSKILFYIDVSSRSSQLTPGTTTEGGLFYLFSVSNFLNGQALATNTLSISLRQLEFPAEPHFVTVTPILNPTIFYDYTQSTSPINQIIDKFRLAFERFELGLIATLENAGFKRVPS
jgi:hypothetical protein